MSPARWVPIASRLVRRVAGCAGGHWFRTGNPSLEVLVTLRFKFVIPINLILVGILAASLAWEWWRLGRSEFAILRTRLNEEARFVHADLTHTRRGYLARRSAMGDDGTNKIQTRVNRIAGQVTGIQRMVEDGRYCVEVLNQI